MPCPGRSFIGFLLSSAGFLGGCWPERTYDQAPVGANDVDPTLIDDEQLVSSVDAGLDADEGTDAEPDSDGGSASAPSPDPPATAPRVERRLGSGGRSFARSNRKSRLSTTLELRRLA
jgi:hypothetical protein